MLKKFISIVLTCAMLASLYVPAFADTAASYDEYVLTDNVAIATSGFEVKSPSGHTFLVNGFVPGNAAIKKARNDDVYRMTINTPDHWTSLQLGKSDLTKVYTDGEKIHISTELMIPTGTVFNTGEKGGAGLSVTAFTDKNGSATGSIGVNNAGHNKTNSMGKLICFDINNRITLFGGRVYTNMNWKYDTWYKLDAVIVTGDNPKAALYVDGQPLTIDLRSQSGAASTPIVNIYDATFDGVKTSSDYVDIGTRSSSGFAESGIYGIKSFNVHSRFNTNSSKSSNTLYVDNLSYRAMSATDTPDIDASFGILGVHEGTAVDRAQLASAEIVVPEWFADKTAKVSLKVDSAASFEDAFAPYTFDLSELERGVHHLTFAAFDVNGTLIKEAVKAITVAENEKRIVASNDFSAALPFNGNTFSLGSSPNKNNGTDNTVDRKTTFEDVIDSAGVTKEKAAKLYSRNATDMYIGYKSTIERKGIVNISYDMYLNNSDVGKLNIGRNSYWILTYSNGKFSTNNAWTGVTANVSFDAVIGYWQNWDWTFDFDTKKITLKVDGITKLDNVTMGSGWTGNVFDSFRITFANSNTEIGNFLAVDNFNAVRYITAPYIAKADFGAENYADGIVKTSTTQANVKVIGTGITSDGVAQKISVVDVAADSELTGVTVSAEVDSADSEIVNVTLSDIALEADKEYKIVLDAGVAYDHTGSLATDEASVFTFKTADTLPVVVTPNDGVAGDITVTDVRYNLTGDRPWNTGVLAGYTGGNIAKGKELRADVMVNNASSEAQTFRVVIATYENGELTGLSLGEECTVLPKAESMVFTTGKIVMENASSPDIKVMILTDTNTIKPVSKAFSLEN